MSTHCSKHFQQTSDRQGSLGPCDVTKKEDLERIVKELEKREKKVNLLRAF